MSQPTALAGKDVVRALYEEAINDGRLDLLEELVHPDYTGPQGERGPAGFVATLRDLRRGLPDIRFTVEDLIAEGDRVAVRWTWQGTHAGVLRGFAPTGKHVVDSGIAIYQLRDGRVARAWLQTDRLGVLQQIGAVPALPAPPRAEA